jgi:predicted NBD/HSP70 family sugar kinase
MPTPAPASSRPASHDAVLAFAWSAGEFTASDALADTGLTRSTTIDALDALRAVGLLRELPNARAIGDYRKGRPARRFALADDVAVIVGVDAGHVHATARVGDLRGRELATVRATLDADETRTGDRVRALADLVDRAVAETGRHRGDVLALCAGVPAPVDAAGRSPQHPTGFWAHMNPDLVDVFGWVPLVRVDNDASLAAVAEGSVGAASGTRDYIALLAGSRLGAGVVVDGRVLRGRHGGVGEMVAFDHVAGVGGAAGLGHRLEEVARRAADDLSPDAPLARLVHSGDDARAVLELAASGDEDARLVVERVGAVLGRIVSVLGSMFDPEVVVVSGAISAGAAPIIEAARTALPTDLDLPAPRLVASRLGADVVVEGAVAGAADAAREHLLDVWSKRSSPGFAGAISERVGV